MLQKRNCLILYLIGDVGSSDKVHGFCFVRNHGVRAVDTTERLFYNRPMTHGERAAPLALDETEDLDDDLECVRSTC